MRYGIGVTLVILAIAAACAKPAKAPEGILFKDDLAFLKANTKVVVLSGADGQAEVAVNPDLQGRVMTSTAAGPEGLSFGWINRESIASGVNNPHMNAFGGEDRFWLGPEGGQFSVFFKKGDPFDLDHWFTPAAVNEGSFDVASQDAGRVHFRKVIHLVNYTGTEFDLEVNREVGLLGAAEVAALGVPVPAGVKMVAYASTNAVTNLGVNVWTRDTGLLSIWILGMFNPSPATTIVIPFKAGPESELGPAVNDAYFGKVPADRLVVKAGEGVLFFSGDGKYRSKIGLSPLRVKALRRKLRRREQGPDARPPDGSRRGRGLRQFDVGDPGEALRRRCRQQLQRRAGHAGRQAARSVLRARNVVAGRGPRARRDADPHPHDDALPGAGEGPGRDRPQDARSRPRRDQEGVQIDRFDPLPS